MQKSEALVRVVPIMVGALVGVTCLLNATHIISFVKSIFTFPTQDVLEINPSDVISPALIETTNIMSSFDAFDAGIEHKLFVWTRLNPTGGTELVVTEARGTSTVVDRFHPPLWGVPRFSPDGKSLAYIVPADIAEDKPSRVGVYLYNLATRQRQRLWHSSAADALFTPDGQYLILNTDQGVHFLDVRTGRVGVSWARRIISQNFSPRGELLVSIGKPPYRLVIPWRLLMEYEPPAFEANQNLTLPLPLLSDDVVAVVWSPNGQRIAYTSQTSDNRVVLWLYNTKTDKCEHVRSALSIGHLHWSADSRMLLFTTVERESSEGLTYHRWRVNISDGSISKLPQPFTNSDD